MSWVGSPNDATTHVGVGHKCCALGYLVQGIEVFAYVFCCNLANEIPDTRIRRHHVGLITSAADYVMGPLQWAQVLSAEIPGHVH